MPTYDYICRACDHEFELFQQMTDPVKRKCPKCGKPRLERLIGTGAGVIFKGGGFYETDYRSDSYRKAAEAEKKSADGASGGEKKKDEGARTGAEKSAGDSSSAATVGKPDGATKPSAAGESGRRKKKKRTKS